MSTFLINAGLGLQLISKLHQLKDNIAKSGNIFKRCRLGIEIYLTQLRFKKFINENIKSIEDGINLILMLTMGQNINRYNLLLPSKLKLVETGFTLEFVGCYVKVNIYFTKNHNSKNEFVAILDNYGDIIEPGKSIRVCRKDNTEIENYYIDFEELNNLDDAKYFFAIIKQILIEFVK